MRAFIFVLATAFLSFPAFAQQTPAKSEAVQIQNLPKEVVDALKTKYPDAQMQKAKKKVENGQTFFGIGFKAEGAERSALLTSKGKLVEHKKVIPASELPAKVAEAVYAQYPNSTTAKAQKVTQYKEEKFFQVEVTTTDKQTKKVLVDAEGKIKPAN